MYIAMIHLSLFRNQSYLTSALGHDAAEQQVRSPPPSLVPRLHVIQSKRLTHSNPLLPQDMNQQSLSESGEFPLRPWLFVI